MNGEAVRGQQEHALQQGRAVSVPYERGGHARILQGNAGIWDFKFQSPMSGEAVRGNARTNRALNSEGFSPL